VPKIRTTITPTEEIDVSQAEADYLESQGLVLKGTRAHTPGGLQAAAVRQNQQDEQQDEDPPRDTPARTTKES
jgi:hypothetical protein